MTWDHPGIGKQTKGRGPATKKAKRRRRERAAAQAEIESAAAARRVADRRHAGHNADDVASGGTLASSERPRLGGRKKDRYWWDRLFHIRMEEGIRSDRTPLPWSDPDSDPIADILAARDIIERQG